MLYKIRLSKCIGITTLSGKSYSPMILINYTLADVLSFNSNPTIHYPSRIDSYSCSGELMEQLDEMVATGTMPVLSQNLKKPITIPEFSWFEIQNIAIIDNMLHTHIAYDENMGRFNQFALKLMHVNSHEEIESSQLNLQLETFCPDDTHCYTAIEEQIITIPEKSDYENIEPFASIISYNQYIEGNWNTTFRIEDAKTKGKTVNCNIEVDSWMIDTIEISPIGLTVYGKGEVITDSDLVSIEVYKKDGSVIECSGSSCSVEENFVKLKKIFETPINIDTIDKVVINQNIVPLDS